ncbi:MAG TPA: LuxR C-terminal-related transcriptional regulator [Allosphingosinicella sp.]|jgi:DNA-binding CsgD family transcriptional regulator|uniref:helix-turn-helix transcriptional regulator n=1 Tax=Allosphingosinicella sp. TaxID=2823234 RepID=UPI002F2A5C4D
MQGSHITPDQIYDALLDDHALSELCQRLARSFDARSTLLHWHYGDGTAEVLSHSGYFTDSQLADYALNYAAHDPWARAAAQLQPPNHAMRLDQLVSDEQFERSLFYNEYIRGMGDDTFRCLGVRVHNQWGNGMVALQRGKTQPAFAQADVAALGEIGVHLRRMLAVRGKFAALHRRLSSIEATMDALAQPALLVSADGRLVYANAAGEAALRSGDVLEAPQRKVEAAAAGSGAALRMAVQLACAASPSASAVQLRARKGRARIATVAPVRADGAARHALLILGEADGADPALLRHLCSLFQLTEAEAQIAKRIADGDDVRLIAEDRQVAVSTVRSQLKALSQKMHCSRQSEIVTIVKSIAPVRAL